MLRTAVIVLLLTAGSAATAETACTKHIPSVMCYPAAVAPLAIGNWKVADVLCCCKTHEGGECCTRAARCGGRPPGCFCEGPSVPSSQQQVSALARDR